MVADPAPTPVTVPDAFTEAIALLLVAQVPPAVASVKAVVEPIHTTAAPAIAAGVVITVMANTAALLQPVV